MVVVVDPNGGRFPKPPLGRRAAHAVSAAFSFGFEVVEVEELPPPPPKKPPAPGPVGSVTPWSFRQLRYAAKAVELPPPPGKLPPFGLRLAQADCAFWNAPLCDDGIEGRVPRGVEEPGLDDPGVPPPPGDGKFTPWLRKQVR